MSINKETILNYSFVIALIIVGVSARFLSSVPNFTPIIALTLFAAAYLPRKLAFLAPVGIMLISDSFIGSYSLGLMLVVYSSLLLIVGVGFYLKKNKSWASILTTSALGGVLFFLVTNFGVWIFTPWYEKSVAGLTHCYFLALPFFRNTLVSTLAYSSVFFLSYEFVQSYSKDVTIFEPALQRYHKDD